MKFKLIFLTIFFLSGDYLAKSHGLSDLIDTTPDVFPFHAVVHGKMVCGGILISKHYIIMPAHCVYEAEDVKVYLGSQGCPHHDSHNSAPNTQEYHVNSNNIFIHEDFDKIKDSHYLNNIAIIKLADPVIINDFVRPGKLISRQETHLLEGRFANISGWLVSKNEDIKYAKIQLRNQDTCNYLFGNQFLRSQELCVEWLTKTRLNLLGNAVTVEDTIIGFQTSTPPCAVSSLTCTRNDMVLNLVPFLDWISHKTNIPLNEFVSSTKQEYNDEKILAKIQLLDTRIAEILVYGKSFYEKYELDQKALYEKIENNTNELERTKRELRGFGVRLNEEIGAIKNEINNTRVRNDQNMLRLQEEVNQARTEESTDLTAQQGLAELQSLFKNLSISVELNVEEKVGTIVAQYRSLLNRTESLEFEVNKRFARQEQKILNLVKQLNEVDTREAKDRVELAGNVEFINSSVISLMSSFINISFDQVTLRDQVKTVIDDYKTHLTKEHESFYELEEKLNEISDAVHKNSKKDNYHFDDVAKLFGEQRSDFDTHRIKDSREIRSLWAAIKDLNATLHEPDEFDHGPNSHDLF